MDVLQIKNGDSLTIKLNEGDTLKLFTNTIVIAGDGAVSAVQSVNAKTGHIILNAEDVGADHKGSANTVKELLSLDISQVKALAETNQLKLSQKVDIQDFELAQEQVELNRLAILSKADIQALAQLALLVETKADQAYVQQQIAKLVGSAPEALDTIYELATALQNNQSLIDGLNQSVANRVRFDVATQVLTEIQKQNARTNIGAEKLGTAQQLVSQITAQSLGAATTAQGVKADTALQSADVAPVALSGQFSSLNGQNKIFDVVYSAYTEGVSSVITASDSLGTMLSKLQSQIKAGGGSSKVEWVSIEEIGTLNIQAFEYALFDNYGKRSKIEFARIDGNLWIRGIFKLKVSGYLNNLKFFEIKDKKYICYAGGSNYPYFGAIDITNGANYYKWRLGSNQSTYDEYSTNGAIQSIVIFENISPTNDWFMIKPQCIGTLVI